MPWLLLGVLLFFGGWFLLNWLANADPALVKKGLAGFALIALGLVALVLLLSGRAPSAIPFLVGGFVAYQRLQRGYGLFQFISRLWSAGTGQTAAQGDWSVVETSHLKMQLNKRTGALKGAIIAGLFAGQDLAKLSADECLDKYEELRRVDGESARLLEAYLDRVAGSKWRDAYSARHGGNPRADDTAGTKSSSKSTSELTPKEAAGILGISVYARRETVLEAHRRLMKIAHPDLGGSDVLARQINAAKDILLKSSR